MFDPNYNKYQNVSMGQNTNSFPSEDFFGEHATGPYIRGVTTHMPYPMPGNVTEQALYPLQSSLATPQFNTPIEQGPQGYAEGGMVEEPKKKKGEKNNPYPSLAEMIRQQGKGEDTILAHINPLEAMMLMQMGGSGTINPATGLPQFGFLKKLRGAATLPFRPIMSLVGNRGSSHNTPAPVQSYNAGAEMVPYTAPAPVSTAMVPRTRSTNEELLDRIRNQISVDQSRIGNANYVPYKGEMVAPISASTTRAQNLKNQWASKPTPYSKKMETVLKRDAQGFSPEQQQNLLNMLRRGTTSEDLATQRLGKQFDNNYGYEPERAAALRGKIGKDMTRNLTNSEANLKNLSNELALLEGRRGTNIVNAFHNAGRAKEGRRNALTNQLEEFGNLERKYIDFKNQANRDAFNEEMMAPQRRLATASQALQAISPYVGGPNEETHPDRARANNMQLQKIMNYYNQPHARYPGQRVVDLDPQTRAGYNLTMQMDPKYRDAFYGERKALERGFMNNPNIATQTYNRIPEGLEPLMANLDYLSKQQMKQEAREISGRHRRMGTYGSGVHKAETEKALRNVLGRVHSEREGALLGVTKNQAAMANEAEQNALRRYGQLTGLGAKEFTDNLATHKNLVNAGNRQWAQKQELENARLQNWYDQLAHESPIPETGQSVRKNMLTF